MRAWPVLVLFALLALVSSGCKSKITQENYDKIVEGMTLKDVELILGEGKQQGDGTAVAAQFGVHVPAAGGGGGTQIFVWENDSGASITVDFANGGVKNKRKKGF